MKNTKLARAQRSARRRMDRYKSRTKASRFTNMSTRKLAQVASNRVPMQMPYVKGTLIGLGLGAELVDVFADVPWYGQLLLGPLMGLGDAATIKKTGELMP